MIENAGRRIFLILLLVAVSVGLLTLQDRPFELGLDLQGGTRLVYSFDFDEARQGGQIDAQENTMDVLGQTIDIIRNRVDPTGTKDAVLRQEGTSRIVIEIPGSLGLGAGEDIQTPLAEPLDDGADTLRLAGQNVGRFPETGGSILIDEEEIHYRRRDGTTLFELDRGHTGTLAAAHTKDAAVHLVSDDAIRQAIENLGNLEFAIIAQAGDFFDTDTDLNLEKERLETWVAANAGSALADFNKVPNSLGGPHTSIRWFPFKQAEGAPETSEFERAAPVLNQTDPDYRFTGSDLSRVFYSQDRLGYPAVGFEMKGPRRDDFGDYTEENEGRQLAIILNEQLETAPTIEARLPGQGIIQGRYKAEEVKELITVLRSGSLRIKPKLEHVEKVGATLGSDYVRRGFLSAIVAIISVLVFMAIYYRRLGLISAVSLAVSFLLLMGGLAFLKATLTLPGIAGLILTVGMAVDANILIFDRIREEGEKGRNVKQAAKTGFEKAMSAILDANITTFLTAVILYKVGTGPVRGFAVTLMIGILTSVFAALVITRLLVHFSLERGAREFSMGKWLVEAKFDFLSKAKVAMTGSIIFIGLGLALFFITPDKDKLGIDFMGGAEVHIVTAEPQEIDVLRKRMSEIPTIGESAEVKPIIESKDGDRYTEFRAIFKSEGSDTDETEELQRRFESTLKAELADLLLENPIQVSLSDKGATSEAKIGLLFQSAHPTADLEDVLRAAGFQNPTVEIDGSRKNAYLATAETSAGRTTADIIPDIEGEFSKATDSNGAGYDLATPIPSSSIVGPQVVGELQDKAFLALAISLFVIVLYIRVRFAEYSYGWAAVAALMHDVLITLGVLVAANRTGLINGEISLPMIAAFLTIIGYSLNDTIVIFDRVRENLPRMKAPLSEVLNTSINQTLSRTILTSITTLIAVLILFVFNYGTGNVLESFSFAMIVGIITGTYSTIFIANPVLLWMESRKGRGHGVPSREVAAKQA